MPCLHSHDKGKSIGFLPTSSNSPCIVPFHIKTHYNRLRNFIEIDSKVSNLAYSIGSFSKRMKESSLMDPFFRYW